MKLSVITINYNNKDGLIKTLDSVVSQKFRDFEWIIIDGGSNDGSVDVIKNYQENFKFWSSEKDKGIYNALNKGLARAEGEYVHFLNSGDWLFDQNVYSSIFYGNVDDDVICSNTPIVLSDGTIKLYYLPQQISLSFFHHHYINQQNSIIKTTLAKKYSFDESYKICADYKSHIQYLLDGASFRVIDHSIAYYDGMGISNSQCLEAEEERLLIRSELISKELWSDVEELESIKEQRQFICKRKSFRFIMSFAYVFCQKIDPFLAILDRKRNQ